MEHVDRDNSYEEGNERRKYEKEEEDEDEVEGILQWGKRNLEKKEGLREII